MQLGEIAERLLEEVLLNEEPGPSTRIYSINSAVPHRELISDDEDEIDHRPAHHVPRVTAQDVINEATASIEAAFDSVSDLFSSTVGGMDPRALTQMQHALAAAAVQRNSVLPQQLTFPTAQSSLFSLEALQAAHLHPAAGFLLSPTAYLLPGTQQLACHCMYNNGTQPCAVHHPPIAYGQASSAFPVVAASSSQVAQVSQSSVQQVTRPVAQNPPPPPPQSITQQIQNLQSNSNQQTIQNTPISSVLSLPTVPLQSSLPPTLPSSMRSVTMRLKRNAPHQNQISRLSSKVRRVEGRPSGDAELSPNEPPSTSQIQRTPSLALGQMQLCTNCQEGARACIGCVPCHHCVYCQHHQAATSTNPSNLHQRSLAQPNPIGSSPLLHCSHNSSTSTSQTVPSPVGVQQVQRDQAAAALQQAHAAAASTAASLQEQALLRYRTLNEAIWTRQLSAFDATTNVAATQMTASPAQLLTPFTLRQLSLTSQPLFVVPRPGFPTSIQNATRLDGFVLATLPPEFVDVRPLERQHATTVFGGQPVAEPQPVGASLADIEKFTERNEFVKDVEVPENEKERCTVCLMEFETGEGVRKLRCTHLFHVDCIDKWLVYNKKCPVCRVEVDCPAKTLLV
ncbi:unnamed protein product, partial [Mesorhabditis belari]|uniref:RING-type domain-containing protein n=1 Tax=Mesorhabditis belari TaxID=2138241 RepID=A0AAF3EJW0_9BILA